jgi:hypothetical protein
MAETVFLFQAEFGHCASQLVQQEDGIVAKPVLTALFGDDFAFANSLCQMDFAIGMGQRHHGAEPR